MEALKKVWKNNGYPAATKLLQILGRNGLKRQYSRKQVEEFVAGQTVSQLHRRAPVVSQSHITTAAPGIMYCIDLLDMTAYSHDNKGMKWLLLVIDIFSRVAVVLPVKNKTAGLVAEALDVACAYFNQYPKMILSDQGSEFKGATATWMKKHDIIHRTAEVGDHNRLGIVDRFSGVVKNWIAKLMTHTRSKTYIDALPELVENYNDAPHSSLDGMTPNEAWKFPTAARENHYERIQKALAKKSKSKGAIQVGDYVRVLKLKNVFDKGYHVKYSLGTHKVIEIKGLNYILDDGKFYRANRLQKVPPPQKEVEAEVKDVAREARRSHRVATVLKTDGIQQENRRSGLRERKPANQLEDKRYGKLRY
jgi:transposase InsO family protein